MVCCQNKFNNFFSFFFLAKFVTFPLGFVHNGVVCLAWPSIYLTFCGDFKSATFNASYTLSKENPLVRRIQNFTCEVLKCLGGPSFFPFHCEVFHRKSDDQLVLCEIASRVGMKGEKGTKSD